MKKIMFRFAAAFAAFALRAQDSADYMQVNNVTLTQDKYSQIVTVTYDLKNGNDPAFVLLDIQTNNISIGLNNIKTVEGDVTVSNNIVSPGDNKTIVWRARADWRGHLASNAEAVVMAFYTNRSDTIPGSYLSIDLSGGANASSYPVSYTRIPPSSFVTDENRSTKLWLKRVEPGTFLMGSTTTTDPGIESQANETQHQVTLTAPFFAGIFEVTDKQYQLVMGTNPCGTSAYSPVCFISYNDIRGASAGAKWPVSSAVDADSFMGRLRQKTGIAEFDLPTEAQWEFTCRAGTTGAWNNGTTITNADLDAKLDDLAWYGFSVWTRWAWRAHPVGLKVPNAWGFYDMHGNNRELCLDWYAPYDSTAEINPKGPSSSSTGNRVHRGGAWWDTAKLCRSASRAQAAPTDTIDTLGFRLFKIVH